MAQLWEVANTPRPEQEGQDFTEVATGTAENIDIEVENIMIDVSITTAITIHV